MQKVREMYATRLHRLIAAGTILKIIYESYDRMHVEAPDNLVSMFSQGGVSLPDGYMEFQSSSDPSYKLLALAYGQHLISMISEVESYLSDIMVKVLIRNPEKITGKKIDFSTILALGSRESLIEHTARSRCVEIMYKTPTDYKKEFLLLLSAKSTLLDEYWPIYTEAKARRDLGVHNDWIVSDLYKSKAGPLAADVGEGTYLIPSNSYVIACRENCVRLMETIFKHCEEKFEI